MDFVSRKKLEIHHEKAYELRAKLKAMGCEWDSAAKAWIAPNLEIKEKCYQVLDNPDNWSVHAVSYIPAWQNDDFEESTREFLREQEIEGVPVPKVEQFSYLPTKIECIKILGEEIIRRDWRDEIPEQVNLILMSGENSWLAIYNKYQDLDWKGKSIRILEEIVTYFRNNPPEVAEDKVASHSDYVLPKDSSARSELVEGTISAMTDRNTGEIVSLSVSFPYNSLVIEKIKVLTQRKCKWNPNKKYWVIPIEYAGELFRRYPYFRCSEKAQAVKDCLISDGKL